MTRYEIRYQYGSYSGTQVVYSAEGEADAIARMWRTLRPHMSLGMAATGARVISRESVPTMDDEQD
jgi:hypothetical protein